MFYQRFGARRMNLATLLRDTSPRPPCRTENASEHQVELVQEQDPAEEFDAWSDLRRGN